jgi:hypothetical protein
VILERLRNEILSCVDANFVETIPGYSAKGADEQGLLPSSGSVSPGSTNLRRHLSVREFICLSCLETERGFNGLAISEGVIAFGEASLHRDDACILGGIILFNFDAWVTNSVIVTTHEV